MKTPNQLMEDLAKNGGAIVSSGECSPLEIAVARSCGRMAVNEDSMGFVLRGPEWLTLAKEGLLNRIYESALAKEASE